MSQAHTIRLSDYSLVGKDSKLAVERGLAEAAWYTSPVPKDQLRQLLERCDWPALRDCFLYFGLIFASGWGTNALWGSWWAIAPMMIYGVLYASVSDSRWHESGHGTAFRTDWLNNLLYEVASFMVLRESVPWRWSHTRHHSDTIIVGRDPEIAVPRPPDLKAMILKCINFQAFRRYVRNVALHSFGKLTPEELTYIPESEHRKVFLRARIYGMVYLTMLLLCLRFQTWMPFVFVLGPNLYGAWLMPIYGWTQHAGLAENVLDHRLNCRTVRMNFINRFLYWNMNYHLEHHMFPLVPYHQLPKLHQLIKDDCPEPYPGLLAAYREIIPAVFRQIKDPGYFVERRLPATARAAGSNESESAITAGDRAGENGWVSVCDPEMLGPGEAIRFDCGNRTYAVYRTADGSFHATDGICTHGNTHLADGLVTGRIIECPKHNGRFDITDGSPQRRPACVALRTYPVKLENGRLFLNTDQPGGCGLPEATARATAVANRDRPTSNKTIDP